MCCFVLVHPPIGLLPSMLFRGLVAITVLNRNSWYNVATFRIMIIQVVLCCHVAGGIWCSNHHPVIFLTHVVNWLCTRLKMYVQCLFGDDTRRRVLSACTSSHAHTNKNYE